MAHPIYTLLAGILFVAPILVLFSALLRHHIFERKKRAEKR